MEINLTDPQLADYGLIEIGAETLSRLGDYLPGNGVC